jgi:heme exporter protein A
MMEVRDLECVRGTRRLFAHLSFSIRAGDCLELRGANGSGKTSLLRLLCGLLPPTSGTILWRGESIAALGEDFHPFVTYIGHAPGVKDELTAMENLRVSSALNGFLLSPGEARAALDRVGLSDEARLPARLLSAGQRRRLALARLVAGRARLWLLDEVLTSLDEAAASLVVSTIDAHVAAGGMAVVATHQDLQAGARRARRIELAA